MKFTHIKSAYCIALTIVVAVIAPLTVAEDTRPNVVMIMVDDAGLMDFQPFGGEARMPNIQALAEQGVRFTNYRTSPLCAPSRAMFLTGVDNHQTGIATIPEVIPAEHENAPGYSLVLEPGVKTIADRLRGEGYRTYMTGKWHMGSKSVDDLPISHGFDRSFILDASGADNWEQKSYMAYYDHAPWFEDDKPATLPEDFYSSQFIIDKMIDYVSEGKAERPSNRKPFLAYLAFQAIHIPIQAPREFTEHYEGVYDDGWHALRESRWRKAQALGLIPSDAPLADMYEGHRSWASLSEDERGYYTKAMMVNAGMLEAMDHHIGRLISWLESQGELENTVFVVTSDNGPEHNDIVNTPAMDLYNLISGYNADIETMGEKGSLVSIGPEWAAGAASPSNLFKFYSTEGGIRVPLIIKGKGIPQGNSHDSFAMVTDIVPTLAELIGFDTRTQHNEVPIRGRSLLPVINEDAEFTYRPEEPLGMEVAGNAALFKGQYKLMRNLLPHGDGVWHLYDRVNDPGETQDLAHIKPELFAELKNDYQAYAREVGVQEMPAGYDSMKQVMMKSTVKILQQYWISLSAFLTLFVLILVKIVSIIIVKTRKGVA
jgi:arylsulfatase/uncharacterized sulfatase